ncbi:cell division septation protein DedD [Rubricella aquisinus]|uniref:Cell division septation protein DedD n=1 Tax=Rubricella aquisinus TaxID=2028108 RepID=A0A840WZ96_9RHOB|nr:SPOR domain-containing protein [Rubricella aquisinus]MBB5516460.1 cell division septation protein DedD [Rubricella aquisinus]
MRHASIGPTLAIGAALATLAACTETPGEATGAAPAAASVAAPAPATRLTEAEVPRPDLYSESGIAVWDGRPSIGAVWVAHPIVDQARRVRITVTETGVSAPGALLKRDPSIPGPPFLLSGDAAARLGLEPGVPARIEVVALERDVIETPVVVTPAETPPAEPASEEPTIAAEPAPETEETTTNDAEVATAPDPAPADPIPEPVVNIPQQTIIPGTATATATATASEDTTPVRRQYVQVGTFGVRSNAETLAETLRNQGYSVRLSTVDGATRPLTRVLIGPATTRGERNVILERLRADGITDTLLTNL